VLAARTERSLVDGSVCQMVARWGAQLVATRERASDDC
jgi:hypothetical protein